MGCTICDELGESRQWGNGCESPHPPAALALLKTISEALRECPTCGTRYDYDVVYEHAADHYMPDRVETLVRRLK